MQSCTFETIKFAYNLLQITKQGRCRIIKCLALDAEEEAEDARQKGRHKSSLISEEKLLTAEFLEAENSRRNSEDEGKGHQVSQRHVAFEDTKKKSAEEPGQKRPGK